VKWARRRPAVAALAAVSGVALLCSVVLLGALWRHADARAAAVEKLEAAQTLLRQRQEQLAAVEQSVQGQQQQVEAKRAEILRLERQLWQAHLQTPEQLLDWHRHQAEEAEKSRRWSIAVWHLDRLIALQPGDRWWLVRRGRVHAESDQWEQAVRDFARLVELQPDDPWSWNHLALAYLGGGRRDDYRRVCGELLKRFGQSKDPAVLGPALYPLVPLADAVADPGQLLPLAETAALWFPGNIRLSAAFLYRAGRFEEALERFHEAARDCRPMAWDWLFLAMAHHRLGHTSQARECLAKAGHWIRIANGDETRDAADGRQDWVGWHERVEVRVVESEAEALVNRGKE
jgi:tetratricopeptide (TPR) repeat protein